MKLLKRLSKTFGKAAKTPKVKQRAVAKPAKKKITKKTIPPKKAKPDKALKKVKPAKKVLKTKPAKATKKAKTVKPIKKAPAKPKKLTRKQEKEQLLTQNLIVQQAPVEKKPVKPYPVLPGGQTERLTMLLPILRELVKKGVISDWLINFQHNRTANVYVERNFTIEDELTAIREDLLLTIFSRFPDGTIGEAQLPIITTDGTFARQQILEAKETCQYARKKEFTLPEPVDGLFFPQGHDQKMLDAAFQGNGLSIPKDIYTRIKNVMTPINDVKVNCFEVLTSASTVRVMNSNGVDVSFHKTSIYLEIVLTCKGKNEEREFVLTRIAVSPEQLDIQALLLQQARIVRDATNALPNPGFTGDVMLGSQSVVEFFAPHHDLNPLIMHTSAKLETMSLSSLHIGQPIGHVTGEPITITSNPHLPLGLFTQPVDEEGTPLKPTELIRNGLFVNYCATARYAQYLDVPATGNVSNVQVNPGATREEHLRGNNYFEIVSFSWFNPNPFSGDFSAEIRLGYHWVNGRKQAFRGGMLVGNVFKNILNARFSKETAQSAQYYGPRAVMFKNAQITKFE